MKIFIPDTIRGFYLLVKNHQGVPGDCCNIAEKIKDCYFLRL